MKNLIIVKWTTSLIILFFLFVAGCSSKPSGSEGKKFLENRFKDLIKVVTFEKLNAKEGKVSGTDAYEMEYESKIVYIANVCKSEMFGFGMILTRLGDSLPSDPSPFLCITGKIYRKGEQEIIKGRVSFLKTEKGWQGSDGNLY